VTTFLSTVAVTPLGIEIGCLPMRDIVIY